MTFRDHLRAAAEAADAPPELRHLAAFLAEHGAELTQPATFGEVQARSQLAHLSIAVEEFRAVCEHDPDFAALPATHPARRLFRTHEQIKAWDRAELATQADRLLQSATPAERVSAALDIANRRTLARPFLVTKGLGGLRR